MINFKFDRKSSLESIYFVLFYYTVPLAFANFGSEVYFFLTF
jgi:hypothetical protein